MAKTKEKEKEMVETQDLVFSYSRAYSIPCYRAMVKLLNHEPPEVLPADIAQRGLDVHHAIENFIKDGDDEELKAALPKTWESIKDAIKDILGADDLVYQEVEKPVEYEVNGEKQKGKIDWYLEFADEIWIIDFKSGHFNEILPYHKGQLNIYIYPFLKWPEQFTFEGKPKKVSSFVWNVNLYGLIGLFRNDDFDHTTSPLKKIEGWFKREQKRIQRAMDNPELTHVSYYCFFCPYSPSCPAARVVNDKSPEELAKAYLVTSAKAKQLRKIIEGIVNAKGNIIVDDVNIGFHYGEKMEVDFGELFPWLVRKHKELIPELLYVNKWAVRKYARKYDDLANFVEIKQTRRWGEKKIKNKEKKND